MRKFHLYDSMCKGKNKDRMKRKKNENNKVAFLASFYLATHSRQKIKNSLI